MAKRVKAPFYTETKVGLKALFKDTRLPNGYLYSKGEYKTKITAEDLPEHYIHGWIFKVQGYISVHFEYPTVNIMFRLDIQSARIHICAWC